MGVLPRTIQEKIETSLFKGKIIIVYGPRQVGKTTLIKEIQKRRSEKSIYLNCDEPDIRQMLTDVTSTEIKEFVGKNRLVFIDEAQRVKNIGITLKLIIDNFPDIQAVATGSSSFDLSNKIAEPLTGRKYEFYLYPFSIEELSQIYSDIEIKRILEKRILFGMYPEIVRGDNESAVQLRSITESYLFQDVLQYQQIKNPDVLERLLQALALQVGNEVSYNELSAIAGIDKKTVANYIQVLEKAFVIFRLMPYSRNIRNELKKLRKIYFFDTGIRNALINNFNSFNLRQDVGSLWENFIVSERIKFNNNHSIFKNIYFWRTHGQQEIDFLEEADGELHGFEFKWNKKTFRKPRVFLDAYPGSTVELINKNNFIDFVKR
jgi:predicted AAA+ superfamily ATPase